MASVRVRGLWAVIGLYLVNLTGGGGYSAHAVGPALAPPEGFADSAIRAVWQRDDGAVASGKSSRPWMWGPGPFHTDYEPLDGSPGSAHLVQYFDKGRLEVNDPAADPGSPWYVSSGRLVSEMVAGEAEAGTEQHYKIGPAQVPVTGDDGNGQAPSYAAFAAFTARVQRADGQTITNLLTASGKVEPMQLLPAGKQLGRYEPATGHNWADVFRQFATDPNRPAGFNWLYTLGYPITEPYWVRAPINGRVQPVLIQLFERRTLTYNPANPPGTQVEMGNVGRHYYLWRYTDLYRADMHTRYDARIAVGPKPGRTTTVQQQVDLDNATPGVLKTVVLHVPWNHWKDVFRLSSATVNGQSAQTAWRESINLEVQLPQPAAPSAHITLQLAFEVHPRPLGGRNGYDRGNDILVLGDMLPTVVPWQNGGWASYPYSELGDLGYFAVSDYQVQIAPASRERLIAGGTGEITAHDTAASSYTFTANRVRDVAYLVSPSFVDPLADSSMVRKVGDVTVRAYFLPEHREEAKQQLALVTLALLWLSKTFGAYPFKTYTVAEMGVPLLPTDNYAQEYPMSYYIPTSWLKLGVTVGSWTWYTPVHEVTHQWFYSTVGSNQLTDPWLDEALTSYVTAEYVRANFPDQYAASYSSMSRNASLSLPVSSGVFSGFANENQYSATVYDSGVQMLNRVRRVTGDTDFYTALRDYYATYAFKIATPANLLSALQKHTQADLKPIFAAYLLY